MAVIEELDESGNSYNQVASQNNAGNAADQSEMEQFENDVAAERQQYQPTAAEKFFSVLKAVIMRAMIFYFIMQFFKRPQPQQPSTAGPNGSPTRLPTTNLYLDGSVFDFYIYVSEQETFGGFNDSNSLVWSREGLVYGDWVQGPNGDGTFTVDTQITVSEKVQNNGSLYIHAFVVKDGKSPDPSTGKGRFNKMNTVYKSQMLNKFKKKSYRKTANLLTGETEQSEEDQIKAETIKDEIISHWHPNLTINLVFDHTPWVPGQVPPPLDEFVEFTPSLKHYKPILWLNDYWNLNRDYTPINSSTPTLNLSLTFQPLSMFKWQMYSAQQLRNRFNMFGNLMGEEEDQDQDSVKEAFLETNIYLLVLTFVISIVHSIFEFLAFKNDIQFWNNRKSLEGLSVRSVFFNVFQSLIVVLYVLDNDTNTMVRVSCLIGLAIEVWKITKVSDVKFDFENRLFGVIPRVLFEDKGSYEESGTKEYDRMAFRYLGIFLFPVGLCYCVYSVIYNEHKGWYSFILSSSYGFLLTFGFIMMTPQLFINYKLKSVAHLPWRMMTYKALNTFIDDIFAFVIKMPTMYRLGCFRDDIVFFIMLYQRYIYREDPTRVNEFGFSAEMLDDKNKKKESGQQSIENTKEEGEQGEGQEEEKQSAAWKSQQKPKSKKAKKID